MDRPTGPVIRRYERCAPGELVHLDVKEVGKVPSGGGWRVHGRGSPRAKRRRRSGYTFIHVAIDDAANTWVGASQRSLRQQSGPLRAGAAADTYVANVM